MSNSTTILQRAEFLRDKIKHCVKIHDDNKAEAWKYWNEFSSRELWRQLGYKSAKEFAEKELKKSYQWLWEQTKAAQVAETHPEVKTVKEALAVRRLAMPQRNAGTSSESGSAGGMDTGFSNQNAGNEGLGRTNGQKLPNDATGIPIPPDIQPFWNRNEEVQFLLGMVSKLRVTLEKADESRDKLFCKIDRQGCISRLKQIYEEIESAKSYAVCPDCNGIFTQDCPMCSGRGTLSKFYWGLVPEEIQRMRKTQD